MQAFIRGLLKCSVACYKKYSFSFYFSLTKIYIYSKNFMIVQQKYCREQTNTTLKINFNEKCYFQIGYKNVSSWRKFFRKRLEVTLTVGNIFVGLGQGYGYFQPSKILPTIKFTSNHLRKIFCVVAPRHLNRFQYLFTRDLNIDFFF